MFYVEDAAQDAVLKIIGKPKTDIQISKGRARVIELTFSKDNAIGFIDQDNSMDSRLDDVKWLKTDDFEHCNMAGKLFIKFNKDVEHWLHRISKSCKVDCAKFKLEDDPEDWHLNQRINSASHDARRFLQEIYDAKDSPLKLLKQVIES